MICPEAAPCDGKPDEMIVGQENRQIWEIIIVRPRNPRAAFSSVQRTMQIISHLALVSYRPNLK
jgi:hypothetical protein